MTLIECVPNFSEGRRLEIIDEVVVAMATVPGVEVLDRQSDATHNRCVITLVGEGRAVRDAAFSGIAAAARLIDLNHHEGAHPRFGAADVVPFVPIKADDMPVCVELARDLAREVARQLDIPVYLYGEAARRPGHRDLAVVRGAGFEELRELIGADADHAPDEGPLRVHPTAGAIAIGARRTLIAYNVNLESCDLDLARRIAAEVRERDGGLPCIKAIGVALDDCVQVSMNLTDFTVTGLDVAYEAVTSRAATGGVDVRECEIVGLLPEEALVDVVRSAVRAHTLTRDQVLEARVLDRLI